MARYNARGEYAGREKNGQGESDVPEKLLHG
jgi:hypothetical protein